MQSDFGRTAFSRVDTQRVQMKVELDEQGHVVLKDNNPVYIHDDGTKTPVDVSALFGTVKNRREWAEKQEARAKAAEEKLKLYEGIDDPESALKALSVVKNLDSKKLVDAGEIEKFKAEYSKAVEEKYIPIVESNKKLEMELYNEKIGGAFARSTFREKELTLGGRGAQAMFSSQFKLEDGKARGYDFNGNLIYSKTNPGEPADFEEAFEILAKAHPESDTFFKAKQLTGGGAPPGSTRGSTNADLSNLSPTQRMVVARGKPQ